MQIGGGLYPKEEISFDSVPFSGYLSKYGVATSTQCKILGPPLNSTFFFQLPFIIVHGIDNKSKSF